MVQKRAFLGNKISESHPTPFVVMLFQRCKLLPSAEPSLKLPLLTSRSLFRVVFRTVLLIFLILPLVCTTGCNIHSFDYDSSTCYTSEGADQFVIDSYKIRQGKFSILEMEGKKSPSLDPLLTEEYQDRIADDDVLGIALFHPSRSDLSKATAAVGGTVGYRVNQGVITLPDLPPIKVTGLTLAEARDQIMAAYAEEIRDVEIFIDYRERLTKKVELIGLVSTPSVPVDGKIRLFDVLAKARIPDQASLFKSYVVRDELPLPVDMYKLVVEGDMSQNIVMRGGDKVFIAPAMASNVMLMGEVGQPKVIPAPAGYISLREAIVAAGGIPFTGNKKSIQVIRGNIINPRIYTLNWNQIVHLPNNSLLLMPGDTVYVSAKPITEWNRFISQLLPSFTSLFTLHSALKLVGGVD